MYFPKSTKTGMSFNNINSFNNITSFNDIIANPSYASTETVAVSLSSPVTSTLASFQASSSNVSHQGRETISEFHSMIEFRKKISESSGKVQMKA